MRNEHRMLARRGIDVSMFERCNDDIDESTLSARAATVMNTIWSRRSRSDLGALLARDRPDIVHVHNTFAMLSPSIYGACRAAGVPVVQTLHNFRFFCPAALFLRDGKPCEECLDKSLIESVRHRCYRGSTAATATIASMLALHRAMGTYSNGIDRYITLTDFGRRKAQKGGIPERKLVVKPNFIPDPPAPGRGGGRYVAYIGRLLEGKGAVSMVDAWRQLPDVRLKVVGDGALRPELEAAARRDNLNIEFTGMQDRAAVLQTIADADFLIIPSECYEGFPMVIAESFACGTPVLASRIGSMDELIEEGVTGRKFIPGDCSDMAKGVRAMLANPLQLRRMRVGARAHFEKHLTESGNFEQLMRIYAKVIADARGEPRRKSG